MAFGYEYLLMASHSAKTVRAINPGLRCELVTNVEFRNEEIDEIYRFDRVTLVDMGVEENRFVKTDVINYTDLDYCVFLDCDTEVLGSLDPIFRCLDKFDVCVKLCPNSSRKVYEVSEGISSEIFPEWNSGVIFFRKNHRSYAFYQKWNEIFRSEMRNRDQPALARTLFELADIVRVLSLNALWNTFRTDLKYLRGGLRACRVWHYREPEKCPRVAGSLLIAHARISSVISDENPSMRVYVEEIGRRYRFYASGLNRLACRHPRLRRAVSRILAILMKAGVVAPFKLSRDKVEAGSAYIRS